MRDAVKENLPARIQRSSPWIYPESHKNNDSRCGRYQEAFCHPPRASKMEPYRTAGCYSNHRHGMLVVIPGHGRVRKEEIRGLRPFDDRVNTAVEKKAQVRVDGVGNGCDHKQDSCVFAFRKPQCRSARYVDGFFAPGFFSAALSVSP